RVASWSRDPFRVRASAEAWGLLLGDGEPRQTRLEVSARRLDLGLLCGKLPRFFLQLAELGLGGALRLVGLRAASLEGGLLRGEIVRLPRRGLLGLLREERA